METSLDVTIQPAPTLQTSSNLDILMAASLTPVKIQALPSMDLCHHPGSIIYLLSLFHSPTAPLFTLMATKT